MNIIDYTKTWSGECDEIFEKLDALMPFDLEVVWWAEDVDWAIVEVRRGRLRRLVSNAVVLFKIKLKATRNAYPEKPNVKTSTIDVYTGGELHSYRKELLESIGSKLESEGFEVTAILR